jgi:hypothetical protein
MKWFRLVQAVSSEIQVKVEHQDSRVLSSSGSSGTNGLNSAGTSGSSEIQELVVQVFIRKFNCWLRGSSGANGLNGAGTSSSGNTGVSSSKQFHQEQNGLNGAGTSGSSGNTGLRSSGSSEQMD